MAPFPLRTGVWNGMVYLLLAGHWCNIVSSAPALPTAVTVSSITTSHVTVSVTLPVGVYDGVSVDLVFGGNSVSQGSSSGTQITHSSSSGPESFTVSLSQPLVPGATFTVRVRSRSGSKYSGYFIVTPSSTVPPASPTAVTVSSISTSQIVVSVTLPFGVYDGVSVDLASGGNSVSASSSVQQITLSSLSTQESFTVSLCPLVSGATYTARVRSRSGTEFSDYFIVKSSITVTPDPPTFVPVSSITTSHITVSVTLRVGVYDGVSVELVSGGNLVSEGSSPVRHITISSPPGLESFTVSLSSALAPGATYTVRVRSRSGSEYSGYFNVTPSSTVRPSKPEKVSIETRAGNGHIVVKWKRGTPFGVVNKFVITRSTVSPNTVAQTTNYDVTVQDQANPVEDFEYEIPDDTVKGEIYTVTVTAVANGVSSEGATFNPLVINPSTPTILTAVSSSATGSIHVTWTGGPGIISRFYIRLTRETLWEREEQTDQHKYTFNSLDSGLYTVTVKAQSGDLNSTDSLPETVQLDAPPVNVSLNSKTSRSLELAWGRHDLNVKNFRLLVKEGKTGACLYEIHFTEKDTVPQGDKGSCKMSENNPFESSVLNFTYNVTGLQPYTSYIIDVYTKSEGATEILVPATLRKTTDTEDPSTPTILTAVSSSAAGSIHVTWTGGPGIISRFYIRLTRETLWEREEQTDQHKYTFNSLDSGLYTVTVNAQSGDLNSTDSLPETVQLDAPPVNVSLNSKTSRSLELAWGRHDLNVKNFRLLVKEGKTGACLYEIHFTEKDTVPQGDKGSCKMSENNPFESSVLNFTYNVTGLQPYTSYIIDVYTKSEGATEILVPATLRKTTDTEDPSTPTILTAVSSSAAGSIHVTWTGGPGIISRFYIRLTRETLWEREEQTDQHKYTFNSLDSGLYTVTVKAQSGDLNSTDSLPETVQLDAPPVNVSLNSKTSRSLELAWGRHDLNVKNFRLLVKEGKTGACLYEIHFTEKDTVPQGDKGSCKMSENNPFESSVLNFTYNVTGLQPYTSYIIDVYTKSEGATEILVPATLRKTTDTEAEKTYLVEIVAPICSAVVVILIVVITIWVVRSRRQNQAQRVRHGNRNAQGMTSNDDYATIQAKSMDTDANYENMAMGQMVIPEAKIVMSEKMLGSSAKNVSLGVLLHPDGNKTTIAIRKCKERILKEAVNVEAEILRSISPHTNMVKFLGYSIKTDNVLMVTEFEVNGDLENYLQHHRGSSTPLTEDKLLLFAEQIASGMMHLSQLNIIHCDLRTHNVLISNLMVARISGFQHAGTVDDGNKVLIKFSNPSFRWMPLETMERKEFSLFSDIWSFGVTFWEIMTYGATPYNGMKLAQVKQFIKQTYRLACPKSCQHQLYSVMLDCWIDEPKERQSLENIIDRLRSMSQDLQLYVNVGIYETLGFECE